MIAASFVASAVAFSPTVMPASPAAAVTRSAVSMAEQPIIGRRELMSGVSLAALLAPTAAFADGANNPTNAAKARAIYGSRVFRLAGATPEKIIEEKNAFTLFTSGVYRTVDQKDTKKQLTALAAKAQSAAAAGDSAGAQAAVKEFIALGKISKEYDEVAGGQFNPKQRRNPGAPETAAIEAQMGTYANALYGPSLAAGKPTGK